MFLEGSFDSFDHEFTLFHFFAGRTCMQRGLLGQNVLHQATHFVGEGGERTEVMLPRGNTSQRWFASRRHEWVDVLHVIVVLFR